MRRWLVGSLAVAGALCAAGFASDVRAQIKPTTPLTPAPIAPLKPAIPTPAPVVAPIAVAVSPIFQAKLNNGPTTLKGFVDLHTHPMAHLAMGGKLLHGAPDVGVVMPAGSIWDARGVGISGATCNGGPQPAASVQEALGSCYSSHAGQDLIKNKCGNHVRRMVINGFEDGKHTNKPHDEDHPPGFPAFTKWPKYNDVIHQQMWIDWVKRAKEGGLRVMVALTVNSMTLAKGLAGNEPYDDKTTGDLQTSEMKKMVDKPQNKAWMEIAYTAADLRRIVGQDKLAVILGSEVDDIGNFAWSKREPTRSEVRSEIDRLYATGIRYIFPVHVIDNHFGGTAMYEAEFPRASKYHFGQWPSIICATPSDGITSRFSHDWDVVKTFALGDAGGSFPVPSCAAGMGYKNARGLTPLGAFALDEMMSRGMLIDIDHGSQATVNAILTQTGNKPGGYPVVSGHNGLRGTSGPEVHENTRTALQYQNIVAKGGIAGVGFGDSTARGFIEEVRRVLRVSPTLPINLGSDINGFVVMPKAENCKPDKCVKYDASFPMARMGTKTWNYNDDGVAHIGLFPDFLRAVENDGGRDVVNKLFDGAENVATMWERAESVGRKVKEAIPQTFTNIIATVKVTDDDVRGGARAWISIQLGATSLPEVEVTHLVTKGANTSGSVTIRLPQPSKVTDVTSVKVRHFSNDCFGCARDYWNGSVELDGDNGQKILKTPAFHIGHETQTHRR
jgi:microsomal dipeptidase-like Zn-dependent dipeptidase